MGLLNVLYRDDDLVAIDKPDALLTHRSRFSRDHVFALQLLRDQVNRRVFPVHRLDRPTSGVMVFGLSSEAANALARAFMERRVHKSYLAIVRGALVQPCVIDHAYREERGRCPVDALTRIESLGTARLSIDATGFDTAAYSLIRAIPETGRMHQIRRHLKHIAHPIIGDTQHGDTRHNLRFRERGIRRLLLHAHRLTVPHPRTEQALTIEAPIPTEFLAALSLLGLSGCVLPSVNEPTTWEI